MCVWMSVVAWLREFRRTLEIITRTLREVVNRVRLCGHHTPFKLLGIHHTLKIAARTLSDVVTRVRLCSHHTHRSSLGVSEVQSREETRPPSKETYKRF